MPDDALDALKDLLASRERRIDLSEFFSAVTIEAIGQLTPEAFPMGEQPTEESVRERVERYEGVLAPLLRPLFMGAYYSDLPYAVRIWSRCLKRLIEAAGDQPTGQVLALVTFSWVGTSGPEVGQAAGKRRGGVSRRAADQGNRG